MTFAISQLRQAEHHMSDEQQKQPATIAREELYRQVWEAPMTRLGEQYGISGNGLKKVCDRLEVPYPPRGYWAKLSAGKTVTQTPLPKPEDGIPLQATITPTPPPAVRPRAPELDTETAEALRAASTKTANIAVSASLHRPHWAIAAWITQHERDIAAARRDGSYWRSEFGPKPFTPLERRQQRFLSTLFKEVEKLGYKVKGDAPYNLSLETGRNEIEIALRERIKQVRRPLTDEEKAKSYNSNRQWIQERIPTGELIFTLKTHLGHGLTTEWRDGERRIDEQIAEVIAVLAVAVSVLEKRREADEEAQHRRWEEEKRRREERERQDQDRNRWRRFVGYAEAWRDARLAGDFIEALATSSNDPDVLYDGKSAAEWMAWARERRNAFDPLRWSIGEIWTDMASVTHWDCHDQRR
jgi:hypothetical protein